LKFFRRAKPRVLRWGSEHNQLVDVYLPEGAPRGVVVLVHGGFWRAMYGREGLRDNCVDLTGRGFVAANVAYRRVGESGGGWPGTCTDVVGGLRAVMDEYGALTGVVGHSAGGQLALWAARELTPRPQVVVSVAGCNDLARADALNLGNGAVRAFTGGSADALVAADPSRRVPLGTRTVLICASDDPAMPREVSETYAAAALAAGDDVVLDDVTGDHFSVLDTGSLVWAAVVAAVEAAS
jgi:acetyl esterase/lipase